MTGNVIQLERFSAKPPRRQIEPIEVTIYRGLRFDRPMYIPWAKAFDAAGLKWEYLPKVHEYGGWLPHFLLPDTNLFVMVWSRAFQIQDTECDVRPLVMESCRRALAAAGALGAETAMFYERRGDRVHKRPCRWAEIVEELRR